TACSVSRQLQLRHSPSSFSRRNTRSPRSATALRNSSGTVSPGTPACGSGRRWSRFQRTLIASPPGLLLLPAPLAARAGLADAEIELADVLLLAQHVAAILHHDAPVLEHVAVVGRVQRH